MSTAYHRDLPGGVRVIELGFHSTPPESGERYDTVQAWQAAYEAFFAGVPLLDRAFRCPRCQRVSTMREFKAAGALPNDAPTNCLGRYDKSIGCDWTALGLSDLCNVHVQVEPGKWMPVFDFACKAIAGAANCGGHP